MSDTAESGDRMRVLGIEGTAWAASAAIFETDDRSVSKSRQAGPRSDGVCETADPFTATDSEHVFIESDAYQPASGGIHPREAAEHMGEAIPQVVQTAIEHAAERADEADQDPASPIDAVAFSRGPGLGPCLRIVGTAARAVAQRFDVPLVGVNHMVAHLEVGRHYAGFGDPVCLNASGANAHVLAYRNGRYRVLGETMDTGVGNALDKFTRHVGWSHPGGPKVETHAKEGEYVDLPYVVKGMDFSFSGIMSAAKQAVDGVSASSASGVVRDGEAVSSCQKRGAFLSSSSDEHGESDGGKPVEDVCRGLEETIFAVLTEVSERALSLTDGDELVLGGGVAQNDRLRAMLEEMCDQRGADFYAPPAKFLRDNAGMIAILGAKMVTAGDTISIEESTIDSDFRPDQVAVSWRGGGFEKASERSPRDGRGAKRPDESTSGEGSDPRVDDVTEVQGAEATVSIQSDRVVKERQPRSYRHPALDERLRVERTRQEARLTSEARRHGVPTPVIRDVDPPASRIVFQHVGEQDLRADLTEANVRDVGRHLARIHDAGFVHGDPTTRNVRVGAEDGDGRTFLIDFGLGYFTRDEEDHAMDLHVFAQSLAGTADDAVALQRAAEDAYREESERDEVVLDRLREIEGRGRYQ